jgi:hypothetical protein
MRAFRFAPALLLGATLFTGTLSGCNTPGRVPSFERAMVQPDTLRPGDRALITVKVRDEFDIVKQVVAKVAEDPRLRLPLRDDGEGPDQRAGDGVWTTEVVVPFQAPPGDFTLIIEGYDADGRLIAVPSDAGAIPLSAEARVVIEYIEDLHLDAETDAQDALEAE